MIQSTIHQYKKQLSQELNLCPGDLTALANLKGHYQRLTDGDDIREWEETYQGHLSDLADSFPELNHETQALLAWAINRIIH